MIKLLDEFSYRRLLDLPSVPVANAVGIRYPVSARLLPDDSDWYLRSFGTDFNLIADDWRDRTANRWFSLGWGLRDGSSSADVLLAQAFDDDPHLLRAHQTVVRERLASFTERWAHTVDPAGDGWCLRFAAVVDLGEEAGGA